MKDELHELILSLTQGEKKHFSLIAMRQGTESKQFYALFNELCKQKVYDEDKLLRKLDKAENKQQFRVLKTYLYDLLLSSLENYYQDESIDSQLRSMLNRVEILFNKSLHLQCINLLDKIEKLAKTAEKPDILFAVQRWQSKVIILVGKQYSRELDTDTYLTDSAEISSNIAILNNCRLLFSRMFEQTIHSGIVRKKSDEETADAIFEELNIFKNLNSEKQLPFEARCDLYYAYSYYYWKKADWKNYSFYSSEVAKIFEENAFQLNQKPNVYINALTNQAMGMSFLNDVQKFDTIILKIKKFITDNRKKIGESTFIRAIVHANTTELSFKIENSDYESALKNVKEVEKMLEEYEDKIPPGNKLNLAFINARVYFANGKYHESLLWCNKIYNEKWAQSMRKDMHIHSRILRILNHFELNNIDHIESSVKSLIRYFNEQKSLFKVETAILNFNLKEMPKVFDKKILLRTAFINLRDELIKISSENDYEKSALGYLNLLAWLDSKINNTSFIEAAKARKLAD